MHGLVIRNQTLIQINDSSTDAGYCKSMEQEKQLQIYLDRKRVYADNG